MKGSKLQLQICDVEIDSISKLQRFTYRCIKMFNEEDAKSNKTNLEKERLMGMWAQRIFLNDEIKITFDETLWLPEDTDSVGNIVQVAVTIPNKVGINVALIDFRKSLYNCISFITHDGIKENINIFNVEYKEL